MNRSAILGSILACALVTPALAQTALTRAQNETNINAAIKANGAGAITGPILNTILNNLAASMATGLDANTFSQAQTAPTFIGALTGHASLDLALSSLGANVATLLSVAATGTGGPVGSISPTLTGTLTAPVANVSGTPSITQSWSGASNQVTLNSNVTAASATLNEATAIFRMTSGLGSGTAGEYKIALGTEMIMNAGSAAGHALNSVLTINSGVGAFTGYSLETDCNNFNEDYPLPNQGGYLGVMANCHAIASGSSTFPGSAAIQFGTLSPTTFAWHAGLYFFGSNLLKDYTIYDGTSSTTSYDDAGIHTTGILLGGTYSASAIQGTGFAVNGAGVASFAQVLVSAGSSHALSIFTASNFLEIQSGTAGIAFPNAAGGANLLLLSNSGAATFLSTGVTIGAGSGITSSGPGGVLGNPAFVASSVSKTCGATIVVTNGVVTSC